MKKPRLVNILVLLATVGLFILVSEFAMRNLYPALLLQDILWPPHLCLTFKPAPGIMGGVAGESKFITNSFGIRADELSAKHTRRILVAGGSAAECLYLSQEESWPYLLQKKLNKSSGRDDIWVGNAGMSGENTIHHIRLLSNVALKKLKIDTVILLIGINDLSVRLALDKDYANFSLREEKNIPFFMRTALWGLVDKIMRGSYKAGKEKVLDNAGQIYKVFRDNRGNATRIIDDLPELAAALTHYRQNINAIIDLAKRNKVRIIFLTQPTLWREDLPFEEQRLLWFGGIGDFQAQKGCAYYSVKALQEGMQKFNDALMEVCKLRKVECVDLASLMPKDTSIFYDDCHFNENGAEEVSDILAEYLCQR